MNEPMRMVEGKDMAYVFLCLVHCYWGQFAFSYWYFHLFLNWDLVCKCFYRIFFLVLWKSLRSEEGYERVLVVMGYGWYFPQPWCPDSNPDLFGPHLSSILGYISKGQTYHYIIFRSIEFLREVRNKNGMLILVGFSDKRGKFGSFISIFYK